MNNTELEVRKMAEEGLNQICRDLGIETIHPRKGDELGRFYPISLTWKGTPIDIIINAYENMPLDDFVFTNKPRILDAIAPLITKG